MDTDEQDREQMSGEKEYIVHDAESSSWIKSRTDEREEIIYRIRHGVLQSLGPHTKITCMELLATFRRSSIIAKEAGSVIGQYPSTQLQASADLRHLKGSCHESTSCDSQQAASKGKRECRSPSNRHSVSHVVNANGLFQTIRS
jgi:hypothetical protein